VGTTARQEKDKDKDFQNMIDLRPITKDYQKVDPTSRLVPENPYQDKSKQVLPTFPNASRKPMYL
jgi:hypothetical protein